MLKKLLFVNEMERREVTQPELTELKMEYGDSLKMVHQNDQIEVYRIVSFVEKKVVKRETKVLYITPMIDTHDLRTKFKRIDSFNGKGKNVKLNLTSRRKSAFKKYNVEKINEMLLNLTSQLKDYFKDRLIKIKNQQYIVNASSSIG